MPEVHESIVVDAPVERVYGLWTNFENFPNFMGNVERVERRGPDTTHWVAKIAGKTVEWDARTTAQEPNRKVAWQAVGESGQSGAVTFNEEGPGRTRVNVDFNYSLPSGLQERAAHTLGLDERAVKEDLENFKRLAEGREES